MSNLFQNGFRPFFLAAGLWALLAMLIWIPVFTGTHGFPGIFNPLDWHIHEMIAGYGVAAISGFLLTAVPNWTGYEPPRGRALAFIFAIWCFGRIAMASSAVLPPLAIAIIDLAYMPLILAWLSRALIRSGNKRNFIVAILIGLLWISTLLFHLGETGISARLGISAIIVLITLIGGRVVPAFTRNWLRQQQETKLPPEGMQTVDKAAMALGVIALLSWTFLPEGLVTAVLMAGAGIMHFIRLARWKAFATFGEPLVTVLHLGYLWVPIGFLALALAIWFGVLPVSNATHALTTGAIGSMTLAIMTRATLGHTGRTLKANKSTLLIFGLITVSAILRVFGVLLLPAADTAIIAGYFWIGAFLVFVAAYGPIFFRPRADQ